MHSNLIAAATEKRLNRQQNTIEQKANKINEKHGGRSMRRTGRRRSTKSSAIQAAPYRVIYVAKFDEAIYVLHCFQKKTQATSRQDKAIAATRYRAVVKARKG